ncbi:TonB-dependent receptor [Spirosoma sordidisoli]|uniref:TonB-dependent receptor n=1 Tax=Spirosoma sordidisoli TaxID=2502893 RepID=A0A4Q2UK46_9BACT|nr:TonB-dependent receptor [Spirosoma sordidisoli]RYC67991.1 TonB-dependent receptor [Spirosoma sordidisoli]
MRNVFVLFSILFLSFNSTAQPVATGTIRGRVVSADGQPAAFVSISLKGYPQGTTADETGTFQLGSLPVGSQTLVVSAVGFDPIEQVVQVDGQPASDVLITLKANARALNEVVVTASRQAESLSKVPSAVSIVTPRQITEQLAINTNITNVLMNTVPGFGYFTNRTSNTGQTLRGRQVLVLIDGVPQSTPLRNGGRDIRTIDPSALERVEVIKGATAIYGNGADGGIINYITKNPAGNKPFSGQTWVGLTSGLSNATDTQGWRLSQQFSGKTNRIDYVLNGTVERTGLFKDATGAVISPFYNLGQMNSYNLLAKVGYRLSDRQRVEVMYNYFGSESKLNYREQLGKFGVTPTIGVPTESVPGRPQGTPYNHNATVRYMHNELIGKTGLEVVAYLQSFRTVYGYEAEFFENGGQSNVVSNKNGVRLNLYTPYRLGRAVSGNLVYGLDALNDQTAQKLEDGRFWTPDMRMRNLAPYAQLKTDFFDQLTLKAGIRYENIAVRVSDFTTLKTYNATTKKYDGGLAVQGGDLTYNALVGNIGLRYSGLKAIQPFVSFSQAFSINELGRILRTSQRSVVSQLETKPIIVNNYEAGIAGQLGRYVSYELNAYRSSSELGASYRQLPSGVFEIIRAPERVSGYEAALDITPLRWLAIGGSYAYIEGKSDGNADGDYETYLGNDRIASPKTTAYIRLQPSAAWMLSISTLTAGSRDRFRPNASGVYAYAQAPVRAYTLVNLSGSYQFTPAWSLALGVENLLNRDYFPAISQWAARDADYIKGNGARGTLTVSYRY